MKKLLSAALALALALSLAISMTAFGSSAVSPDLSAMPASQLAYMDVYSAAPEVQQAILNARAEIIYGDQAWSANEHTFIVDLETGEATRVPTFEELFPGWDIPRIETSNQTGASVCSSRSTGDIYNGNVKLQLFHDTELGVNVITFNGTGGKVGAFANSGPVNARYNLSVTKSGMGDGWYPSLAVREGIQFETSTYFAYTVHASACDENSANAWYRMIVTEDIQKYAAEGVKFNDLV